MRTARHRSSNHESIRALGLALIALAIAGSAAAEVREWNQGGVTRRAEDLHKAVVALLADSSLQPVQDTAMQDRELAAAVTVVRESEKMIAELVKMLKEGYGRPPTQPLFDRIGEAFEEGGQLAGDAWIGASARAKVNHMRDAYALLRPFYRE
jgi:hypothetical protein